MINHTSHELQFAYAGDQKDAISQKNRDVREAWDDLMKTVGIRKKKLADAADEFLFFNMVRDLITWMNNVIRQIDSQEKPK